MRLADPDRQAGFALVESIAVLALSALVLLTLLIAADLVSRNSAAAARRANATETLATGLAAVRRDLEGATYVRAGPSAEDPLLFSGRPQAVAFAREDDRSGVALGESLVLIEARYEEGRGVLLRSSAGLLPGTRGFGSAKFANHAVLVSGPWKYRFSYADLEAGSERWLSAWTATARMPAAIRLEVLDPNGRHVLPPLTVRVHVDASGCAGAGNADCLARSQAEEQGEIPSEDGDVPVVEE
jgi:general secretion pathway protein J